ncbi:FUSC family protein [Frateuria hangzhouensis]|uniref:FUSC family protein n=1 Tax=Frateuria hangzhouensis TaxID=2995589 RepID=UPI002260E0CB|nr:FUSC family protein [Frateuria sp. STR12]MCX7514352.1 FUSC family protein [Frateuria sp. STR12]
MSASVYSLRVNVLESLTRTKRPDVPLRVVVRNALAVVLPLAVGMACGHTAIGLGVAVGALDTMFSDQPGPYRQRVRQLLLASLAAGLAAFAGFLLGGHLPWMLLASAAIGFGGGMLVVFGTDLARVGMTSMILLVVTAASPTSLGPAAAGAALIFAGGLLMMSLSIAAWPLQRYRPERQALAVVYRGLAAVARQRAQDDEDEPALSSAMTTLQQTLLGRYHARGRAMEAFGVMLELAERIRLELTALADGSPAHAVPLRFRVRVARVLEHIAEALEEGVAPLAAERALRALQSIERHAAEANAPRALHVHALAGQLAAAVRNANWAGSRGEQRAETADLRLPVSLRQGAAPAMLLANLTPHSVAFRHAVRSAVALSLALALSRWLELPHGYWLPMTVAIVLRPDFGATFNFGLLRVVGTVLGLLLTTALLHVIPDQPWAHLALMGVLCMAFRYLASAHYGIAVAALTGTVVVLLSFEGVDPGVAVMDRVINTALGSGMALLAYVLWPTWERGRARAALADMIDGYADYLRALGQPQQRGSHHETRTAARTARTNALASLERMRAEPGTPAALLDLARALFANGNRLARTAMTLEALLHTRSSLPEQTEVSAFIDHGAATLHGIAGALREQRPIADLPDLRLLQRSLGTLLAMAEDQAGAEQVARLTDRLVDNVNTLAHVIGRCPQEPAAQSTGRHVHP